MIGDQLLIQPKFTTMASYSSPSLWLALSIVFSAIVTSVSASEICVYHDRYEICDHGCCNNGCCLSPYQIAGIVFGALAFICIIAVIVLYCVKRQKRKGRVITDGQPQVMMVNGYHQQVAYTTTQPFAPGYAASYGHPGVPPPYSANAGMPPGYSTTGGGNPAYPPPPAYHYNDPAKNPFAAAANAATAPPNGGSNPAAAT